MTRKVYYFTYTFLEYLSFSFILYHIIGGKKIRRLMIISLIFFTIFMTIHLLFTTDKRIDSIPIGVETILILVFIYYYFFNSFQDDDNNKLYKDPGFWFVIGMLVYLGSTFFFNILANNVDTEFMKKYWHFTFLGDILKNIIFSIGILAYSKQIGKSKEKNTIIDNLLNWG